VRRTLNSAWYVQGGGTRKDIKTSLGKLKNKNQREAGERGRPLSKNFSSRRKKTSKGGDTGQIAERRKVDEDERKRRKKVKISPLRKNAQGVV